MSETNTHFIEEQGLMFTYINEAEFKSLYEEIFTNECYRFDPLEISADELVIDLGAYLGMSTLYLLETYAECTIYAVEANPGVLGLLRHNITINYPERDVVIVETLICDNDGGQSQIHIPISDGWQSNASIVSGSYNAMIKTKAVPVRSQRLDTLIGKNKVGLLKIDIEGSDILALSSLGDIAKRQIKAIVIEAHSLQNLEQIKTWADRQDFKIVEETDSNSDDLYIIKLLNKQYK